MILLVLTNLDKICSIEKKFLYGQWQGQGLGQVKDKDMDMDKKTTIFCHWCTKNIFLIHNQMSGSSLARFFLPQGSEILWLKNLLVTKLPDIWQINREVTQSGSILFVPDHCFTILFKCCLEPALRFQHKL